MLSKVILSAVARLELRKQQSHLTDEILDRWIAGSMDVPRRRYEPALELRYALLARQIPVELRADFCSRDWFMKGPLEWRYTSPAEVRQIFNRGQYWERLRRGELHQRILKDRVPVPPAASEPRGTRSQYIAYLDEEGDEVARVHQYLRPDGTLEDGLREACLS